MPDSITPPEHAENTPSDTTTKVPDTSATTKPAETPEGTTTPAQGGEGVITPPKTDTGTQPQPQPSETPDTGDKSQPSETPDAGDTPPAQGGGSITVTNSKHYSGQLLKRYYDGRAESSIGIGAERFEIVKGKFGVSSFVVPDKDTGKWKIEPIPMDATIGDIKDVFAECDLIRSYSDGRILIRAIFPHESMTPDEEHQFTTLGIVDREGQLIAVLCCKPIELHKGRTFVIEAVIETNIA